MNKPKPESPGLHLILVSYIPLLVGEAGVTYPPEVVDELVKRVDEFPSGAADACLWLRHNAKSDTEYQIRPVFLMKDAAVIASHLKVWAEGKPEKWFRLHLRQMGVRYAFALVPDFGKSIERQSIAYQLRTGFPLPKDTKYTFLFRGLHFVSGPENTFLPERHRLAEPTMIGFLDTSMVDKDHIDDSMRKLEGEGKLGEDGPIHWMGPFHLAPNKDVLPYLDSLIEDAKEPSRVTLKR